MLVEVIALQISPVKNFEAHIVVENGDSKLLNFSWGT